MAIYEISLGLLVAPIALWALWRRGTRKAPPTPAPRALQGSPLPSSHAIHGHEAAADPVGPAEPVTALRTVPRPLEALSLRAADRLAPEKLQWFADELRAIPRPPQAVHLLVSPRFIAEASSAELSDLVMSDPLVAAKVMAKVHSPVYGLRAPVTRIGQAITFIGMTTVRDIGLRYLLETSFKSDSVQVNRIFETLGEASTLGSELSLRLAQRLRLPDAGAVMTHVLLSFTGHLAATVLQVKRRNGASRPLTSSLLQRVYAQQQEIGLAGSEIGRLLMREWQLPDALVEQVAAIDRVLVTPVTSVPPSQAAVLAVGYLSARLGERLAHGQLEDLSDIDDLLDADPDFHHLHGYLAVPALRELRQALKAPDLLAGLQLPAHSLAA